MKRLGPVLLTVFAMVLLQCSTSRIYTVIDEPIPRGGGLTLNEVTEAIKLAGLRHHWYMAVKQPGHIVATIHVRKHMAKVDIYYTPERFSIMYKDSRNLDYSPRRQRIHNGYGRWVKNLTLDILISLEMASER